MRVGERRDHRTAAQIQQLGATADNRLHLSLAADGEHAAITNADRLDAWHGRVKRVDRAIIKQDGCHGYVLSANCAGLWYAPVAILSMPIQFTVRCQTATDLHMMRIVDSLVCHS